MHHELVLNYLFFIILNQGNLIKNNNFILLFIFFLFYFTLNLIAFIVIHFIVIHFILPLYTKLELKTNYLFIFFLL